MAPMLIASIIVGMLVSIFQAATQIHEMTLVFVPKIVACLVALVAALPWMINLMLAFTEKIFVNIPMYIR